MNSDKDNTEGYLYILYNIVFIFYGENVYKLGKTMNMEKRLLGYTTSYLHPCDVIFKSALVKDRHIAEKILFDMLYKHRFNKNREFFMLDSNEIISTINHVVEMVNNNKYDEYIWNQDNAVYKEYMVKKYPNKNNVSKEDINNAKDISKIEYNELICKKK